jgi:hypothetical protein
MHCSITCRGLGAGAGGGYTLRSRAIGGDRVLGGGRGGVGGCS